MADRLQAESTTSTAERQQTPPGDMAERVPPELNLKGPVDKDELSASDGSQKVLVTPKTLRKRQRRARRSVRAKVAIIHAGLSFALGALFIILSSIYFSANWNPNRYLNRLKVLVVNMDTPAVVAGHAHYLGRIVAGVFNKSTTLDYSFPDKSFTQQELRDLISDGEIWGAVFIPQNLSASWANAFHGLTNQTAWKNPVQVIIDGARGMTASATIEKIATATVAAAGQVVDGLVFSKAFGTPSRAAPAGAVFSPITAATDNLNPITKNGWFMAQFFPFTVIWVALKITTTICNKLFVRKVSPEVTLPFIFPATMRLVGYTVLCIAASAGSTMLLAAFNAPAVHGYSAIFGVTLLTSLAFAGLQMMVECWIGPLGTVVLMIYLYIQMSICGGSVAVEMLATGWRGLSYIVPHTHGTALMRYVMFNTLRRDIGLHVGVLFAWAIGALGLSLGGMYVGLLEPEMRPPKKMKTAPK